MPSAFQAGIVASIDALVKEFVSASNEEQKAILSRMEEEVAKLTGSSASLQISSTPELKLMKCGSSGLNSC
ncbi:hypothetical protein ZIOFF_043161 [Zingiber officinale]|uniref:Endoplasmic reticulum resident protein 29 C-terminal domain-containing protein n=1 Tax=Zingiber officinale TaxID=94328 RepID=A0A8J5G2Z4_ZINOF|nr:hypothetical protein ZIOFF_043161 [Zingiber officinale]